MEPAWQKSVRFGAPHPLVAVAGVAVLALLAWLRFSLGLLSGGTFVVVLALFLLLFTRLSRHSARKMRERHLRQLEQMRGKPVLHLNDPD